MAFALAAVGLTGCADVFGDETAQPGEPLGTFHVSATAKSNACGEGALGATDAWEFDVKLSRGTGSLLWDNGSEVVSGELDADDVTFRFDSGILVDMRTEGEAGKPPCSVARHDAAEGVLDSAGEATAFSGSLRYDFAPTEGSQCDDLIGVVVLTLPCSMSYGLEATRTEAPAQ